MILRTINLENFGLYAGSQIINLAPKTSGLNKRPIVLFGGKNGAGKTTLLEAVRLALYGRRALGARVGESEYYAYLDSRIHTPSRCGDEGQAAVGLEFDYAEAGVVHRYKIRREWVSKRRKVAETLTLEKDGALVASVPREEWAHFLQELIPPGVSQLFFFDGEKIASIAEGSDDDGLAEAMRSLLGVDLVGRLRTDLGLFLARHRRGEEAASGADLEAVLRDIAQTETAIEDSVYRVADLRTQRDVHARALEGLRRRFAAEGGEIALQRGSIEARQAELRRQIGRREAELKELANGLLPLAAAPKLLSRFRNALAATNSADGSRATAALEEMLLKWAWERSDQTDHWSVAHVKDVEEFVLQRRGGAPKEHRVPPGISDPAAVEAILAQVADQVRPRACSLSSELQELVTELGRLEESLARANDQATSPLLDEVLEATRRLAFVEHELAAADEELRTLRGHFVTQDRRRRRLLESQAMAAAAHDRSELASRVANALSDYENRLLEHKVRQLSREFVRCFRHLIRKPKFIADIQINVGTFETRLIAEDGREIAKSELSAGEKQVYATAMLWALARTSGRALPMIIDTPLGRLDLEHRANLVERYFPVASHQVIVLSTDSEIGPNLYTLLEPNISHSYRLDFDPEASCTRLSEGYFDHQEVGEPRRALQQA